MDSKEMGEGFVERSNLTEVKMVQYRNSKSVLFLAGLGKCLGSRVFFAGMLSLLFFPAVNGSGESLEQLVIKRAKDVARKMLPYDEVSDLISRLHPKYAPDVRLAAIRLLEGWRDPSIGEALFHSYRYDGDPAVRKAAGEAVAPYLAEYLKHPDAAIRLRAISYLRKIRSTKVIWKLRERLEDEDHDVVLGAAVALIETLKEHQRWDISGNLFANKLAFFRYIDEPFYLDVLRRQKKGGNSFNLLLIERELSRGRSKQKPYISTTQHILWALLRDLDYRTALLPRIFDQAGLIEVLEALSCFGEKVRGQKKKEIELSLIELLRMKENVVWNWRFYSAVVHALGAIRSWRAIPDLIQFYETLEKHPGFDPDSHPFSQLTNDIIEVLGSCAKGDQTFTDEDFAQKSQNIDAMRHFFNGLYSSLERKFYSKTTTPQRTKIVIAMGHIPTSQASEFLKMRLNELEFRDVALVVLASSRDLIKLRGLAETIRASKLSPQMVPPMLEPLLFTLSNLGWTTEDEYLKLSIIEVITCMGPGAKGAAPALGKLLIDGNQEVRLAADAALEKMGIAIAPLLIQILRDKEESPTLQFLAAEKLGHLKVKEAVPALLEVLRDENQELSVQVEAAKALQNILEPAEAKATPEIQKILKEYHASLRKHHAE